MEIGMADDVTTALQALMQQVTALTEKVDAVTTANDKLTANNQKLTDELKDAQRDPHAAYFERSRKETEERELKSLGIVRDPDGKLRLGSNPTDGLVLTREEARDPVRYKEAKAMAAEKGVALRVVDPDARDQALRNTTKDNVVQSKVFTFDDTHERVRYIRSDMNTGTGIVDRHRQAERDGFKVRTFRTPDDLPPHARQKFVMMERAANVED